MKKILLTLLISFLIPTIVFSQESEKTKLFDEFSKVNCEYLLALTDAFYVGILNDRETQGYAVIDLGKEKLSVGLTYERWIRGNTRFRNFPKDRIKIIRTKTDGDFKVQFWLVPNSDSKPDFSEKSWDFTFNKGQKPFIFSMNYGDSGICPGFEKLDLYFFAEYMNANPKARSNIVINTRSNKNFAKEKKEILELIVDKYKISKKRLRFFHTKKPNNWSDEYPEVEVWILP